MGFGNEAAAVGLALPLRRGKDVVSLLHRDFAAHLIMGSKPLDLFNQYMANAESPTHGREGNAHHGCARERRFPMISHLGNMVSLVVGGVWAARKNGEDVVGLSVSGDGGTSTGDFHESLNIASVRKVPTLFLIENNHYAYSVPTRLQYNCEKLSDRAKAYNIPGKTVDGLDPWEVYTSVCDAFDEMRKTSLPYILECMTLRLDGHAVYDKAEYVPAELRAEWALRDPITLARKTLIDEAILTEEAVSSMEARADGEVENAVREALACARPDPKETSRSCFCRFVGTLIRRTRSRQAASKTLARFRLRSIISCQKTIPPFSWAWTSVPRVRRLQPAKVYMNASARSASWTCP